jgi:hypothetical protein
MTDDLNSESMEEDSRAAISRLAAEAVRLRQISELQSLKENRVDVSVNAEDLLDMARKDIIRPHEDPP